MVNSHSYTANLLSYTVLGLCDGEARQRSILVLTQWH